MNRTINMFLAQIVRDRAVPLSLSQRKPERDIYAELLWAQRERAMGLKGRTAEDVLADMDRIIGEAERKGDDELNFGIK